MQTYLEQELSELKQSEKKLREENEIKQKRIEILEHNVEALLRHSCRQPSSVLVRPARKRRMVTGSCIYLREKKSFL